MTCTACPLHLTAKTVCIPSVGDTSPDVLIVLDQPGDIEDRSGEAATGPGNKILHDSLAAWKGTSYRITYLTRCRPPGNRKASVTERTTCTEKHLWKEIEQTKPKMIVAMGDGPALSLCGVKGTIKHGGRTHTSEKCGQPIFVMPPPGYLLHQAGFRQTWTSWLWKIPAMLRPTTPTSYRLLTDAQMITSWLFAKETPTAFDYETQGLSPWKGRPISVALSREPGEAICFDPMRVKEAWTKWLRSSVPKIVHNLYFETIWSMVHFGVEPMKCWDTQLFARMQDENAETHLKTLALHFTNLGNYSHGLGVGTEEWHGKTAADVWQYNCADADATLQVYRGQCALLRNASA